MIKNQDDPLMQKYSARLYIKRSTTAVRCTLQKFKVRKIHAKAASTEVQMMMMMYKEDAISPSSNLIWKLAYWILKNDDT